MLKLKKAIEKVPLLFFFFSPSNYYPFIFREIRFSEYINILSRKNMYSKQTKKETQI